jgi:xyloglucan-specific exo-beta-1,4-glucanase
VLPARPEPGEQLNEVTVEAYRINRRDPNNGAILKSTDQGNTWSVAPLPFKVGGNMPGRGNGERLAVDPNNSNVVYFGATGDANTTFGLWESTNGGRGNVNTQFHISVKANGIEETSIGDLAVPPSGPQLLSGVGDIRGFYPSNVTIAPSTQYQVLTSTNSLDFLQNAPSTVVRAGNGDSSNCENSYAYSTDGGQSWTIGGSEPSGVTGSENDSIAMSPDGKRIVWEPDGTTSAYSSTKWTGSRTAWTAVTGLPAHAKVRADRVTANMFYGFSNGVFYISTNGTNFSATASSGLPSSAKIVPVYNKANDVWLASPDPDTGGVWHTTQQRYKLHQGVGYNACGWHRLRESLHRATVSGDLPGWRDRGVRGYYRSIDGGATWTQINDSAHEWYDSGYVITGGPNIFGRVYIATNDRGIIYGDGN